MKWLVLALLTGCGPNLGEDFETARGVRVIMHSDQLHRYSPGEIDVVVSGIETYLAWPIAMKHSILEFEPEPLRCGECSTAGGCYENGWIRVTAYECITDTAWGHELVHQYLDDTYGDPDGGHSRAEWSAVQRARETLEGPLCGR